jgi:hypothetical protein
VAQRPPPRQSGKAPVVVVGAAGVGAGYLLATDTRVGETTTSTVGAIDQALSTPGQESWLLGKDEERQQAWDQGEYGTAGVDAVEEGAVGLAGAVGGLAAGAESAAKDYAGMAWDVVTDTDPDS